MGCDTLGKECYYAQKPTTRRWRRASRRLVDTRENRSREKGAKLCWLLVVTVYIVLSCIVDYFICEVVGRKLTIRASEITPSAVTWANKYQLRDLNQSEVWLAIQCQAWASSNSLFANIDYGSYIDYWLPVGIQERWMSLKMPMVTDDLVRIW